MTWNKKPLTPEIVRDVCSRFGCDMLTASVLVRRSITQGEDMLFFLEDDLRYVHNPFLFHAMEDAVDRILDAKEEGERILIFGDRDVDGITSTTILYEALTDLGIDVRWRLPTGNASYGLTIEVIDEFAADAGTLIITVDCGITAVKEIAYAGEKGIEVIVVDHHIPQETLPEAIIINPKVHNSGYPFRNLAGCGVTYKLVCALRFSQTELYKQEVCLLHIHPITDAYMIEAIKVLNMAEVDRLTETIVPGMVSIAQTRLLPFLRGQQIFVWDEPLQQKHITTIFGANVEFNMLDMQSEIGKVIPSVRNVSLLRLKDLSRIARYQDKPASEIDGFFNLFVTFVQKTTDSFGERTMRDLQLVALGTLADLMSLQNENRIIIRKGIESINTAPRKGLLELLVRLNLLGKKLSTTDIAWNVTPSINATGRMGKPELAVQLFLQEDQSERDKIAGEIVQLNKDRRQLGADMWLLIEKPAYESVLRYDNKLVLVCDERIQRGVTGIMASKLVQAFKVPSIIITYVDGHGVASMRSTRGYDVHQLLDRCADLFLDYGGHHSAAGFSFALENQNAVLQRIAELVPSIELSDTIDGECLEIDADLPSEYLTPDLLKLVDLFEPYGEDNEQLVFSAKKMRIIAADIIGKTEKTHLKLTFDCGRHKWPALFWQASERLKRDFDIGDTVSAVFQINRNTFNGAETAQMILLDIKKE